MKRFVTILFATLALTGLLCVTASAASFAGAAEELAAIGMLKGGANGFDLDKVPTRAQAAIMLVRLFGAEPEAQGAYGSGRITCPFTDVNETAAPYVAWLADEGLANGTSETVFGAAEPCTAKAYTIFLLRALGYEDGEDFTPGTAQAFAAGLGIVDTSAVTGTFLRDDLAALTYQALGTDLKDGSTYLLDSLIALGDIKGNDAYPIVEKIENMRALNAASEALNKGLAMDFDMDAAVTVSSGDMVQQTEVAVEGDLRMILDQSPKMSANVKVTAGGESESLSMWMRGDWLYVQSGGTSVKMAIPDLMDALREALEAGAGTNTGAGVLPFLESVTAKTSGKDTVYTVELNGALVNMVNSLMAESLEEAGLSAEAAGELEFHGFTICYTVSGDALKSISADAALSMDMELPTEAGDTVKGTAGIALEMQMDITASGDKVSIRFPDFSGFEDVIGAADGPTGIFAA